MNKIKLPKVLIPSIGLYDLFLKEISQAMNLPKEDVKTIFNL